MQGGRGDLEEVVEEAAGEDVEDADARGAQRVQEEEELAHSGAGVERVERLVQTVQLRSAFTFIDMHVQVMHIQVMHMHLGLSATVDMT